MLYIEGVDFFVYVYIYKLNIIFYQETNMFIASQTGYSSLTWNMTVTISECFLSPGNSDPREYKFLYYTFTY